MVGYICYHSSYCFFVPTQSYIKIVKLIIRKSIKVIFIRAHEKIISLAFWLHENKGNLI